MKCYVEQNMLSFRVYRVDVVTFNQNYTHNWTVTERFYTQLPESHRLVCNGN